MYHRETKELKEEIEKEIERDWNLTCNKDSLPDICRLGTGKKYTTNMRIASL